MTYDPAAELRDLAQNCRQWRQLTVEPAAFLTFLGAIANLIDGIAGHYGHDSNTCVLYITDDALAVAEALGIEAERTTATKETHP